MKKNHPITTNEVLLKEGEFIVSKTDLKGRITEVNREFIDISGFSESELLGCNHNIVRHPEMPAVMFNDLWQNIKADKPWTGLVKNRCKNGDYYWTHANVTPVREDGKTIGYMSLRTRPSENEKKQAEEFYKRINEGKASLHAKGLSAIVCKGKELSISYHLSMFTAIVFLVLGLLEYAIYKGATLKEMHVGFAFAYIFMLVSCWGFYKYIKSPLDKSVESLQQLANGEMIDWIEIDRDDEFGRLLQNIKTVQIRIGYDLYQTQLTSEVNGRINEALYKVHSPVLITDTFSNIVFINSAMKDMLVEYKDEIDKHSQGINLDCIVGQHIDVLALNEDLKQFLTANADGVKNTSVGSFYMSIRSSRVVDAKGKAHGVVMVWRDCYQENVIEKELANILQSALNGDLSQRLNVDDNEGFISTLSLSINQLIEVCGEVVDDTARVMGAVASGDLSHKIDNTYEGSFGQLRQDVNKTVEKLTEIISGIHESSNSVSNGTHELAKGNHSLAERTKLQAQSVDETSSGMSSMIVTVRQNAEHAVQANTLAAEARQEAEDGVQVVSNAVLAMDVITESSNKIAAIIGVIDEIAFQTNLLALNAAVEAARAGEQGRGFAVVANEVRNLAGRSAVAAKEIKELIEDSVTKVGDGAKLVNDSGNRLSTIMASVKQVSEIISDIADASKKQSTGIEAASKSIEQIDEITKSNRELVQQATVSSTAITEQVNNLTDMVGFFRTSSGVVAKSSSAASISKAPGSRSVQENEFGSVSGWG